jgi:hypothetical protein
MDRKIEVMAPQPAEVSTLTPEIVRQIKASRGRPRQRHRRRRGLRPHETEHDVASIGLAQEAADRSVSQGSSSLPRPS